MIKAIIFDWGGVLIENPHTGLVAYCAHYLNVAEEEIRTVFHKFEQNFQKGTTSEDVFWEKVCIDLGIQKPSIPSLWGTAFRTVYRENKEIFSLASSLKKNGYKIGFLSNTEIPAMNFFNEQNYDMFDVTIFSCAEGMRKPEKKIYQIAFKKLQVQPNETVFIDDNKEYINGAEQLGMNAILFKNYKQVKKELSLFSVPID